MRRPALVAATLVAAALLAAGQTPEPTFTVAFADGVSVKATLNVRYAPDGSLDASTVSLARPNSPKRDQSRVTGEELSRAPGVLTPLKLFVTETWEAGPSPLDVGETRKLVLTGFTKQSEDIALERLADDKASGNRNYLLDGAVSHWKIVTDGRRLVSLKSDHGVTIRRD